jgi:hypothetical protein
MRDDNRPRTLLGRLAQGQRRMGGPEIITHARGDEPVDVGPEHITEARRDDNMDFDRETAARRDE